MWNLVVKSLAGDSTLFERIMSGKMGEEIGRGSIGATSILVLTEGGGGSCVTVGSLLSTAAKLVIGRVPVVIGVLLSIGGLPTVAVLVTGPSVKW